MNGKSRSIRIGFGRRGSEFRATAFGIGARDKGSGIGARDNDQRECDERYTTNLANVKPLRKEDIKRAILFTRSDQSKRHEGTSFGVFQGIFTPRSHIGTVTKVRVN